MIQRIGLLIGAAAAVLLPGLALLLLGPRAETEGCTIYRQLDFDQHKGNFRAAGTTHLERSNDSCSGKALCLRRTQSGGDFGAHVPLFIEDARDLRIAYHCKAKGVPYAMINLWDNHAGDNLTPRRYQPLSADHWTPVFYRVDDFRYNGSSDPNSRPRPNAFLQNLLLYGESEGSADTWMLVDNLVIYRGADLVAPTQVEELRAAAAPDGIRLSWKPAADNIAVMHYTVARADGPQGVFREIARTCTPFWENSTAGPGEWIYRVRACDFEGNLGPWSELVNRP